MTVRHVDVYRRDGIYAGWPANHGAWQRGDEFLVGFMTGPFVPTKRSGHRIGQPWTKQQARSVDGGDTWAVEMPNVDFNGESYVGATPAVDLSKQIIRCCGYYDHGGETCTQAGAFYRSRDFGRRWDGPFDFGVRPEAMAIGTMRTAVLDGTNLVFLTYTQELFRDYTMCVEVIDGLFYPKSIVCKDEHRAACPAVARVGDRICVALRRRAIRSCWIDLFGSDDQGMTWRHLSEVAGTGGHNGNPPAVISVGERLFCAYANRTDCAIYLHESRDGGVSWVEPRRIRTGSHPDVGYPRLLQRADGDLVCLYYWSQHGEAQHIAASIIPI